MNIDREPISDADVAAEINGIVTRHDKPATSVGVVPLDRRVLTAGAVALAATSVLAVLAIVSTLVVLFRFDSIVSNQEQTISVERSRSAEVSAQLEAARQQLNDYNNQTLCRGQIANDFEDVNTRYQLLVGQRNRLFSESLTAILGGDRETFQTKLADANGLDQQIEALEPKVAAAAASRRDSVATCAAQAGVAAATHR